MITAKKVSLMVENIFDKGRSFALFPLANNSTSKINFFGPENTENPVSFGPDKIVINRDVKKTFEMRPC